VANVVEPSICQACGRPLPIQAGRGRRRQYCDERCRDRARRQGERASSHRASDV